jgi:hypothetical protein
MGEPRNGGASGFGPGGWLSGGLDAKFGPGARLTPRQREARQKLGPNYRVDRWGPQHVGLGAGAATGAASVSMDDDGR